jgi:predicted membrane channel-forming protein YqfA (hemolysin III family)
LSALSTVRLYPIRYPCYSFLLEAESTPGPQCIEIYSWHISGENAYTTGKVAAYSNINYLKIEYLTRLNAMTRTYCTLAKNRGLSGCLYYLCACIFCVPVLSGCLYFLGACVIWVLVFSVCLYYLGACIFCVPR